MKQAFVVATSCTHNRQAKSQQFLNDKKRVCAIVTKCFPWPHLWASVYFVATWHSLNRGQLTHLDAKQSRAFVTTWIPSPRTMFYGFAFCWYFTEGTLIAALLRFVMSNDAVHFSHRESCSYPWAPPNAANSYFYARNAPICWENTLAMILHNIIVYLCVFLNDEEWGYHEKRQTRVATDTNTRCKAIPCIGTLIRFVTAKAR